MSGTKDADGADVRRTAGFLLDQIIWGAGAAQMVFVVAKLGIADVLKDGPKRACELAESVEAEPQALYRLLRALSTLGIFKETPGRVFHLTSVSRLLCSGEPDSRLDAAIMNGEDHIWRTWGDLLYAVRTGKPAFDHVYGVRPFAYLADAPGAGEAVGRYMAGVTGIEADAMFDAYDFSNATTVVDVGGGSGELLSALLKRYPGLRGLLVDLPEAVEEARSRLEKEGVIDRCEISGTDFFRNVPAGGDVYILKRVIHDWRDEQAVKVLANCRRALSESGRVLIVERVIPDGTEPHPAKMADVFMLLFGGIERTVGQYRGLLETAGLSLSNVISTASLVSIVEAVPA